MPSFDDKVRDNCETCYVCISEVRVNDKTWTCHETANNDENVSITSVTTFDRCRQFLSDIGFIGPNQLKEFIPL